MSSPRQLRLTCSVNRYARDGQLGRKFRGVAHYGALFRGVCENRTMNQGIEEIRKRGSRILKDGAKMLPAASLMKAEGLIRSFDDLSKPIVTIVNSYTTQIPGHAHLDKLGAVLRGGTGVAGLQRLVHQRRRRDLRRHRHGALRHEVLAALARADHRPDRDASSARTPATAGSASATATRSCRRCSTPWRASTSRRST